MLTLLFLSLGLTVSAQANCVTCIAAIPPLAAISTICPTTTTSVSTSTLSVTATQTVTSTKTKTVAPSCTDRSAQFYLASPTPGCASSFSSLKRTQVVPGQCVNVADISGTSFTPNGFFELVANDNLPGEKCFVNLFNVADCKGGAVFSYGSSVAGDDESLSIGCKQFKIPNATPAAKQKVVSFKYTCGCGNVNSAKMLFARGNSGARARDVLLGK